MTRGTDQVKDVGAGAVAHVKKVHGPTPSGGQMTIDGEVPKVHVIVRCRNSYRIYEIARSFKLIEGPKKEFGRQYVTATFEVEEARLKEFRKVARGSIVLEVPE